MSTKGTTLSPLIQYWHEKNPPPEVLETLASFKEHNPAMKQLVFDEASAEQFIAASHGARAVEAFRACGIPAMQADYFRYCAVHALGGIYADANFRCLRDIGVLLDGPRRGFLFGRQDPVPKPLASMYGWPHPDGPYRAVTNGLFGFADRGHQLPQLALEAATANIENRVAEGFVGVWISTGPGIFTSIYLLNRLGSIDAFLRYAAGTVIEPSASLLCEVVDDYARIARVWDDVEIRPLIERDSWGTKTDSRLGSTHWARVSGSIYRNPRREG